MSFNDKKLLNNSVLDISTIAILEERMECGIKDSVRENSLFCNTDNHDCCGNKTGEWSFPGSNITDEFCVIHDNIIGRVSLARLYNYDMDLMPPYYNLLCCTIPDIHSVSRTLCVNSGE